MQRDDDRAETVATRLDVYDAQPGRSSNTNRKTGKLVDVNALASVEAVAERIASAIGTRTFRDEMVTLKSPRESRSCARAEKITSRVLAGLMKAARRRDDDGRVGYSCGARDS